MRCGPSDACTCSPRTRPSSDRKSNAHQVLDHALAVALKEHGKMVKTADGHEVRAVGRMHVLTAYKAVFRSEVKRASGARPRARGCAQGTRQDGEDGRRP